MICGVETEYGIQRWRWKVSKTTSKWQACLGRKSFGRDHCSRLCKTGGLISSFQVPGLVSFTVYTLTITSAWQNTMISGSPLRSSVLQTIGSE
jgi:hypothetical protein